MKKITAVLVVMGAALALASSAFAWHVTDVTVTSTCNAAKQRFDITASIIQSQQYPGAVIHTLAPDSFPFAQAGKTKQVTIVIKWPNSNDTQTLHKDVTLGNTCSVPVEPPVVTPPVTPPTTPPTQVNRSGYCDASGKYFDLVTGQGEALGYTLAVNGTCPSTTSVAPKPPVAKAPPVVKKPVVVVKKPVVKKKTVVKKKVVKKHKVAAPKVFVGNPPFTG